VEQAGSSGKAPNLQQGSSNLTWNSNYRTGVCLASFNPSRGGLINILYGASNFGKI
jgi:hypothetical protein